MWFDTPLNGASLPAKTLCLTFDDGPCERTLEIAQSLNESSIPAAFFFVGKHLEKFPGAAAQVRKLGHIAGNHAFIHRKLTGSALADEDVIASILDTSNLLRTESDPIGRAIFFRPPYRAWSPRLSFLLNRLAATSTDHIGPVGWDIDGKDYACWEKGRSPEMCSLFYLKAIAQAPRQSGIVLCHDHSADNPLAAERNRTPEMIRILITRLRDQGFAFASLRGIPGIATAAVPTMRP
jgi:peptidoglycan/xylan/chitin deacetylase (PgdA/CDA1 family)